MSEGLTIRTDWLARRQGDEFERRFLADIAVGVGDQWLTRLEDLEANTVRKSFRGCAHRFASWFATNWWRLRWESVVDDFRRESDWQMAHSLASAGGGYVWPNIIVASEGDFVNITSIPNPPGSSIERVNYLDRSFHRITASEFEKGTDAFMSGILSRLHSEQLQDEFLPALWEDVLSERSDPEATTWRRLEALCGYDPDEAPNDLIESLRKSGDILGKAALRELAAEGRHQVGELLNSIAELARASNLSRAGGFPTRIPSSQVADGLSLKGSEPWRTASSLASRTRNQLGLDPETPISNEKLADILGTIPEAFTSEEQSPSSIPIALASENGDGSSYLFFNSPWRTSRRFAATRLLGDRLFFDFDERLVPATRVKNSRQQFQRAFAQKLLCPSEALLAEFESGDGDDERIEKVARHFDVSPLLVRTTLVNKGEMDRSALLWNRW